MFAVIGGTRGVGLRVARRLAADGFPVCAIGRSPPALQCARGITFAQVDIARSGQLRDVLQEAKVVVSAVPSSCLDPVLDSLPSSLEYLAVLGSTRRFSRYPDKIGRNVAAAEEKVAASAKPAIVIHPTMIYGNDCDNALQRIISLVRRTRTVFLPDGGKMRVQPVHVDDLANAVYAAVTQRISPPGSVIVAGPAPVTVADLFSLTAASMGRPLRIHSAPVQLCLLAAAMSRYIPGVPTFTQAEVRRFTEERVFDIDPARRMLGIRPMAFEQGIHRVLNGGSERGRATHT